jgi:hypothetical protein
MTDNTLVVFEAYKIRRHYDEFELSTICRQFKIKAPAGKIRVRKQAQERSREI